MISNVNFLRDSLYNCHPGAADRDYAKGVIVGLFSGLMSTGLTFEQCLRIIKTEAQKGVGDMTEEHLLSCLPESWVAQYKETQV